MTSQEFCYWLQGFIELQQPTQLNAAQTQQIKDHLSLVFTKVTPDPERSAARTAVSPARYPRERRLCDSSQIFC